MPFTMKDTMSMFHMLITLIFVILVSLRCSAACPSMCTCKWKNGKQTAECVAEDLSVVPSDLNVGTQVLDLSRNKFKELPSRAFQKKGLIHLQKIKIAENEISYVTPDAFYQLSNLVELDLTKNKLQTVPSDALRDCPNIRRLYLAHNPIKMINSGIFSFMSHLTHLHLANCQIKHIQPGAFGGLQSIEVLELQDNQLTTLSIDVLESLDDLFGLHLDNNPWHCDCKIRDIRKWMMDRNIPILEPPICHSPPALASFSWKELSLEDFACAPKMVRVPTEATVIAGCNASIVCQVNATPQASIHWEVSGRSLKNLSFTPELRAKYNIEMEESSTQSSILTIYNTLESDSDTYMCVAENKAGTVSMNFSLSVVCSNHLSGAWSSTQITVLLFGILFLILLAAAVICLLLYHPISFPFGTKANQKNVLQHLSSNKQDAVEMNDISTEKEEKDLRVADKQPRHETGSSGYGSDQLTPDLVSKIADMNNGPSLSTSTFSCNYLDSNNTALIDGYGSAVDHFPLTKAKGPKYDGSPIRNDVYSEIYMNPCYGKDDYPYNFALQSTGVHQLPDFAGDRYVLQNDRVRTLKGDYETTIGDLSREESPSNPGHDDTLKRYPLVVANSSGHYVSPLKARFSPDEGYAEESVEATLV